MNKRILDSKRPVIIYNPTGVFDIGYFKSCYDAGALPVFDTEFFTDEAAKSNIEALSKTEILFGIRVNGSRSALMRFINEAGFVNIDVVVVYYDEGIPQDYQAILHSVKTILEVVEYHPEADISRIDPSAIIIRGFEAGGRVSKFTSFILMQWYLENVSYPVIVHGGVGFHTAAGIFSAGCSAIVLDSQLYLTDESPLSDNFKNLMMTVDEGDSTVIGESMKFSFRFFSKLGTNITKEIKDEESHFKIKNDGRELLYKRITGAITSLDDNSANALQSLFYLGQDGVFAKAFAARSKKVSELIRMLFENVGHCLNLVDENDPLNAGSKLALDHGLKFPIIQGPMANISDNAEFAMKLLDNGSLPFFAMGNLPKDLAEKIIKNGISKVKSFGCGLIGLTTNTKNFEAHLELLKKYKVQYALIAAGTPSQVNDLESNGIRCYFHCPSSQILENAINSGVKRFVFEGMEAGGHIGTLTSFVLFEVAMEKFLAQSEGALIDQRIIFSGGVGTRVAADFVSGLSSVLAAKGAAVGISVGTTYLLTKEIVETEALKPMYQKLLIENHETTVIGATLGLSTRTVRTPYAKRIIEKEHEMIRENVPLGERKHYFEAQNVGSLLIAAKAFSPNFEKLLKEKVLEYIYFDEKDALDRGNYHTGQSLAFYKEPLTIPQVHELFFGNKSTLRASLNQMEVLHGGKNTINDEIAIIGMGCIYPDAPDPSVFWKNIISKKYSIRDVPTDRCNPDYYYSTDRKSDDKTYTKIAGFVDYFEFDAKKYGYSDDEAKHMSRSQKMVIETALQAAADAGYPEGEGLPKERTAVIIGTCLTNELLSDLTLRQFYPEFVYHLDQIDEFKNLPEAEREKLVAHFKSGVTKGLLPKLPDGPALNVESARVCKHLGIEGINFTIDAACATSFAALDAAIKELLCGNSDVAIVGGVNTNLSPEAFVGFSKMGALADHGSYPFDERAGGFVLGEGVGIIVVKRMKDALADGDRIRGVIKGIGASSDGKGRFIAAPSSEGQAYAVKRAYENMRAPITPDDVDYIEAHGTSTIAGDGAEMETIKGVYNGKRPKGVSSIKSQVGHLLGGAGNAGLIKTILAMENKTLPPNGQFEKLSPKLKLEGSPLYIIKDSAEWKVESGRKRRAAISSYGFGGINYHVVLEEFDTSYKKLERRIFADPSYDHNDDRIVVTGIGTVLPGAMDAKSFWQNLQSGRNTLSEPGFTSFHNEYYAKEKDPNFNIPMLKMGIAKEYKFNGLKYKIPPMAQKVIDRSQFFSLDAAGQVIEESKLAGELVNGNKIGLMFGATSSEKNAEQIVRTRIPFMVDVLNKYTGLDAKVKSAIAEKFRASVGERYYKNTEDTIPGMLANITTGRVANFYNCNGANFSIDAECAASAVAISVAVKDLRAGTSDFIIAGGVDTNLTPPVIQAFYLLKVISPTEGKIYDKTSNGLIMSEGAALMALTTLKRAREKNLTVYAEIADFAFRSFPRENNIAPTEAGFIRTFNDLYRRAPITRSQVKYIDGFASSNKVVDKWELTALNKTFNKDTCLGNVKPEIGYYRSANPAVVFAKFALMAKNRTLLESFNYKPESSMLDGTSKIVAVKERRSFRINEPLIMGANFSGLGGLTGHGVMRTLPSWLDKDAADSSSVTTFAAASAAPVSSVQASTLSAAAPAVAQPAASSPAAPARVCALLSGQGAQSPGMMKQLYAAHAEIKSILDQGESLFKAERGYSILDIMFGDDPKLNSTENTQVAIFLSSASIHALLAAKGFAPDLYIGHSIGEYTALYCAGILPFDQAMKLILARSSIMKQTADEKKGVIMVVFADAPSTEKMIAASGVSGVWIANKNSDKQTAVSGTAEGIDAFAVYLTAQKVTNKKLNLSGAFHSPLFAVASEKIDVYLEQLSFNGAGFAKIVSNVSAQRYPSSEADVKSLLVRQISSPVEFVNSVKYAASSGVQYFVEIGPNKLLTNLLRDIPHGTASIIPMVDLKGGESASFAKSIAALESAGLFSKKVEREVLMPRTYNAPSNTAPEETPEYVNAADFNDFIEKNRDSVTKLLQTEYQKHLRDRENDFFKRAGFYGGSIVISGVSIGLPGRMNNVFEDSNFDRILSGMNLIEPIDEAIRQKMVDHNIVRVHKDSNGNARFVEIKSTDEVLQLAGQLGYFNPKKDYGIEFDNDITYDLAIAAGVEALKDAKIPLVPVIEKTSVGTTIAKGFALPAEMQERTGVIFPAVFSGLQTLVDDFERYAGDKFYRTVYDELEKIYHYIVSNVSDEKVRSSVTEWFMKVRAQTGTPDKYVFNRNILFNILHMGNAYFAQMIKAKGPNVQTNAACASTTQAVGIAQDWIRTGRCDRVIIIAGEAATTNMVMPFLGSGFLGLGAATIKKVVSEAALPFDENRNGMIMGSGAIGIVVERGDRVNDRGFNGQAEILGVHIKNSAFHGSRLDVNHVATEMKEFINETESLHGLNQKDYASKLMFMSHETYTPARGGSADAEVYALRKAFPDVYKKITITNTKGFTGHTLSAGLEDCVMVKALQKGMAAPIANLKTIPENFADLRFSRGERDDYQYGIHFAAGFGSQFAILFVRRIQENSDKGNDRYNAWLSRISGSDAPQLGVVNGALAVTNASIVAKDPSKSHTVGIPASAAVTKSMPAQPAVAQVKPAAPAAAVMTVSAPASGSSSVVTKIKQLIADMTGYGIEMLDSNLDLEADLGIDTVKQVEIFGKICEQFGVAIPEDLKLTELNNIDKLAAFISAKAGIVDAAPVAVAMVATVPAGTTGGASSVVTKIKQLIADMTGYGIEMLDSNLDLEADLGIDTVKQVEIFGKICEQFGVAIPEDLKLTELNNIDKLAAFISEKAGIVDAPVAMTAAVSAPAMTTAVVSSGGSSVVGDKIKTIIAEMTGYGIEMLDTNLDLEADLGIDTVKQVEIFGKICEQFGVAIPEDLKLTELNNIEKLAAFIAAKAGIVDAPVAAAVAHVAPVMTTAVASSGGSSVVSDKIKTIISEMTGYGVEMLDTNLDLEADLGIDTVKQVEIFGKICEQFGVAIPEDLKLTELNNIEKLAAFIAAKAGIVDAPVAAAAPVGRHASLAAVQSAAPASGVYLTDVTNVIAEMTGYGVEMLDSNLDLEGDLGIDTVKQVEIFGKVCEKFGIAVPEDLRLTELNTIAKLAAFIAEKTGHAAPAAPVAMAAASSAPAVQSAPVQSMTVAAAPSSADGSAYLADVTNVIAEMTGYGVEMLDSNLDLESDLGIDTVKQVEIFGKACEKFGIAVPEDLRLTELNTIAKLAAFIAGVKDGVSATPAATADTSTSAATDMALPKSSITRFVVRPIPAPQVQETKDFFKGKKVIITADAKGLANKIGERITSRGGSVQYIGKNDLDFGNLSAVEKKFTELSAGGIDGLIHAMTLDGYFDGMKTDKVTVDAAVKSLFVMIKSLGKNLNKNGAFVAAPSFDSVIFPYTDTKAKIYPVFGAVSGMLKSVNKEYKDTRVKAIDFSGDYAKKLDDCADLFITELSGSDARVESGYKKGERFKITIVDEPVSAKTPFVSEGDVVLLSGGARGITFEILKELVKQYKVRPVILARSEITSIDQDFLKDGADEKYIFGVLAQKMAGAKPLEIKKAAAKALNQRDTVRNIRVLEAMGVEVKYHAVDVTNADAVKKIVAQYEKIDGVIHAAGVEESQLIEKKDMKTFDLVFDTKIDGVRSLIGALEGKTYRYFIGFSSVAARFGNEGQTDYSAANEMLARTLQAEKRRFADRIYKVYDWTAWGEVGMATKESVMKFLTAQGVQLLPVKLGVNLFMSDLNDPKEEEVVITNLMPAFDRDGIFSVTAPGDGSEKTPFLGRKVEESKGYAKFLRTLDLKNDIFLPDHALNGVPLFLGSTGVETMAEAASQLMGKGKTLVEMREFTIPYGIKILQGKPKDILVDARALSDDEAECSIKSQFVKDGKPLGDATIHYNGIYRFASKAPEAVTIKIPKLKKVTWEGNLDEHLYHPKRLFMFGLFKSISDIIGVNDSSMVAVIHNKHKGPFFANIVRPAFQTNPVVVDGAFQICGLSEFLTGSESILPYRIRKMQFFRKVETHDEYICVVKNTGRDDNEKTRSFDVDLADRDGNLFFRIEGFQMIAVEKLAEEFRIAHKFKVV